MPHWSFLNQPSNVEASEDRVTFTTHPFTDYWHPPDRIAANGHFYYTQAALPFSYGLHLQCTLRGEFKKTYDQAGIMIRASPEQWIKAGVEYVDGVPYLSSVVANPLSDWAIQPYPVNGPLTIRLTAEPAQYAKIRIEYHNGARWIPIREVTGWSFGKNMNIDIGVMACSPGNSTFKAEFWDIIAQDYSELEYQKGLHGGTVNPNLNPGLMGGLW